MSEIEKEDIEIYAIWDSANTSVLFKNFQTVEIEKQQVKGILE